MRVLGLLAVIAASLVTSALLATRYAETVTGPAGPASPARPPSPAARDRAAHTARQDARRDTPAERTPAPEPARRAQLGPHVAGLPLVVVIALELAGGTLGLTVTSAALAVRRTRQRRRRTYALYPLHLSPHDEAKPQDLEDMTEAIANLVRAFPADRARHGQPFIAVELHHRPGPSGDLEWRITIRCEPAIAVALDGVLSAAYPDVRLGHVRGDTPTPDAVELGVPGYVMRFRKQRSLVYPLLASGDELASPPLEAIAHAQVSLSVPSTIRFALTPAPVCFETLARRLYRRHENRLVRRERWGLPEGGLTSTLNRAEMHAAERTQNRSLFWLELVVAAHDRETCRQLAAAVQARRGENRLHRRWMTVRQNLYRRRFATATPPLIPSPRALTSAAEMAHLLALPTARMKGVPVRRLAIPRVPMPPEILRAPIDTVIPAPADAAVEPIPPSDPAT